MHDPLVEGISHDSLSLAGQKILLTRMQTKDCALTAALQQHGAVVTALPLIRILPLPVTLPSLNSYDWIFFTSQNGVDAFFKGGFVSTPPSIATVGPSTAHAVQNFGHRPSFVSPVFEAITAARLLIETLPHKPRSQPIRILWPCGNLANPDFIPVFKEAGILIDPLIVYQTEPIAPDPQLIATFLKANPTVLVFTSPSAVNTFSTLNLPHRQCVIACIGPTTGQQAQYRLGKADIIAHPHTFTGLVEGLCRFFNTQHQHMEVEL